MVTAESNVTKVKKPSLRSQVFNLLDKQHGLSPRMLLKLTGIRPSLAKKYRYLWRLDFEAGKRDRAYGAASNSDHSTFIPLKTRPDSQHRTHAGIHGKRPEWMNRSRFPDLTGQALDASCGWKLSKNQNGTLLLGSSLGHITWHQNGNLVISAKRVGRISEQKLMANVKTMVYRSFVESGLVSDQRLVDELLSSLQWHDNHDFYKIPGLKSPPVVIKNPAYQQMGFQAINVADGSHRDGIEIHTTYPPLLINYENLVHDLSGLLEKKFDDSKIVDTKLLEVVTNNTLVIKEMQSRLQESGITKDMKKPEGRLYE
jgi:hypothetical protein